MFGDIAPLLDEREDGRHPDGALFDLHAQPLGDGTGHILVEAAARDVRDALDRHFLHDGKDGLHIDAGGCKQRLPEGSAVKLFDGGFEIAVLDVEHLAHEGKPVAVHARRGQRDHHVARLHLGIVDDLALIDDADGKARKVVIVLRHRAGMLGGLTADERAARLHAAFRDAADDLGDALGHVPAAGDIVEKEKRLCAAADDVVDAHGDAVDADRIVLIEKLGDAELGADAVRARNEHGLLHPRHVEREEAAEAADIRLAVGHGARDVLLHELHRAVARGDVDARLLIALRKTLFHGAPLCVLLELGVVADGPLEAVLVRLAGLLGGIDAVEACHAELRAVRTRDALGVLEAQIPHGIGADDGSDLLRRVMAGDEVIARGDVRAVVAGVEELGRRGEEMHFRRARVAKLLDDGDGGRTADDAVVHEDDALALHFGSDDVELDAHPVFPHLLIGGDERPADVLVLQKADAVRDARSLRIAHGGVETGIGHADNDVRLDGIFLREEPARLQTCVVHIAAVDLRIGAGGVEVLEDAERLLLPAVVAAALDAVFGEDDHLAGLHFADLMPADGADGARFGSDEPAAVIALAVAERPEALRIARGDELTGRHDDEGICALDAPHGVEHRLFDGTGAHALFGDDIGDDLGIGSRVEDAAFVFELRPQFIRIDEVAVVGERHIAL